ncbi:MAG: high-potential iron-sulfur protein [Burkholderiales bacterium]
MNDKSKTNRRSLLKSMAALAGIAVIPASKKAFSAKAPQASVQYQDKPKGDQQCDNCAHWEAPDACKVVEGKIAPKGWCAIWVKTP